MKTIPKDDNFDATFAFIKNPYLYILEKCESLSSDIFIGRLLLKKTIFMKGRDAAKIFYDENRFVRKNAMPMRIKKTLLGIGGVQGLDGAKHVLRKKMFMDLTNKEKIADLIKINENDWENYIKKWSRSKKDIILYDEICELLTKSACKWTGIMIENYELKLRTKQLKAMFDYAGSIGLKHWISRLARSSAENWISIIIKKIRSGKIKVPKDSAAYVIANYKDIDGKLLNKKVAAVELLNILRPTVAVAVYIVFTAHALAKNKNSLSKINDEVEVNSFIQEIRRFYPFFPCVMAIVKNDFIWQNYHLKKGTHAILDLYGTNHDKKLWYEPNKFKPERFKDFHEDNFTFIPQGGGNQYQHHRCPGELVAIELMKNALFYLTEKISFNIPKHNLEIDFSRLPALPKNRLIINNVIRK